MPMHGSFKVRNKNNAKPGDLTFQHLQLELKSVSAQIYNGFIFKYT